MSDKKIYKLLSVFAFMIAVVASWSNPMIAITGMLIAIYSTLWAILAHLEDN